MKRFVGYSFVHVFCLCFLSSIFADEIPRQRLDTFAKKIEQKRKEAVGYPVNQNTDLKDFYEWYYRSKLYEVSMNNVGDPRQPSHYSLNTHEFENEVIDFFAPLFGFSKDEVWGIVTMSGTDGNAHGMYFGVRELLGKTKVLPILYVSEEAHYSIKRLGDVMNLEMRLIKSDVNGKMIIDEFKKALDPTKPALVVIAMGTTFKGAIDDQAAIAKVIREKKPIAVYIHVDAALFGGYLPFTEHNDLVNRKVHYFDSIVVSGHKFFGFDEPMGVFLTTKKIMASTNPFKVNYLNEAVPTITCSRNAVTALKFWWKIKKVGIEGFKQQAKAILSNAKYLEDQLVKIGWPVWRNPYSNTVYFKRPNETILDKYDLAPDFDARLGGDLAHCVVMQHVTPDIIDQLIRDMKQGIQKPHPSPPKRSF